MEKAFFETESAMETQKIAKIMAEELMKIRFKKHATILALSGDLGSGKTTFVQGFAGGLGIKEKIKSPTFLIMRSYKFRRPKGPESRSRSASGQFTHIDAYRLTKPGNILALGWKDLVKNPKNIIAIEWARHIKRVLPKEHIDIDFKHASENKRKIKIYAGKK